MALLEKARIIKGIRVGIAALHFAKVSTTLTKHRLYHICHLAPPVFFSHLSILRVWLLTFPAWAREPFQQ